MPGSFEDLLPDSVDDASAVILQLRRQKESDEVAEIKDSLALIKVAYNTARDVIVPGVR